MDLKDEDDGFQQGRQLTINTGTTTVNIISTFPKENLDVLIEKALDIIDKLKR